MCPSASPEKRPPVQKVEDERVLVEQSKSIFRGAFHSDPAIEALADKLLHDELKSMVRLKNAVLNLGSKVGKPDTELAAGFRELATLDANDLLKEFCKTMRAELEKFRRP